MNAREHVAAALALLDNEPGPQLCPRCATSADDTTRDDAGRIVGRVVRDARGRPLMTIKFSAATGLPVETVHHHPTRTTR
jgi:hypothetical protein